MSKILTKAWRIFQQGGIRHLKAAAARQVRKKRRNRIYHEWVKRFDRLTEDDRLKMMRRIEDFRHRPKISIIMPVYNVEERFLREALDSVIDQIYPEWELCIADDNSTLRHIHPLLDEYKKRDGRIKVVCRKENGHISAASNSALELATGEFTALMDHDDILAEDALFQAAELLNGNERIDLIYSDEDKIDAEGLRFDPMFKPDWSPDLFRSINLVTHLCLFRTEILHRIGGFRSGFEGSQDYDLALRFIEQIPETAIRHIPHVLYHWRAIPGSVALDAGEKSYAHRRARKALNEHFARTGVRACAVRGVSEFHRTIYELPDDVRVSIVITHKSGTGKPGTDNEMEDGASAKNVAAKTLKKSDEIFKELAGLKDGKPQVELIIVEAFGSEMMHALPSDLRISSGNDPFFARLNAGARAASGNVLIFLSAETVKFSQDAIVELASVAFQPHCGAAAPKIVNAAGRVCHAGYVLGGSAGVIRPHSGYMAEDIGEFIGLAAARNASAVSASCLAIRREAFEQIGGFDAAVFPEHYADIDLSLRLLNKGFKIVWTPWAEVTQIAPPELPDNEELNRLKIKWKPFFDADPYYNSNLSLESEELMFAFPPRRDRIRAGNA